MGTPLIFEGVVANRLGNFYAEVILYFLVSVMRRSESWRDVVEQANLDCEGEAKPKSMVAPAVLYGVG